MKRIIVFYGFKDLQPKVTRCKTVFEKLKDRFQATRSVTYVQGKEKINTKSRQKPVVLFMLQIQI